jgi:uncharacterized protein
MDDLFAGTWSLVTGASSGIGGELARGIAARRGHLVLVARTEERLAALAARLEAEHGVRAQVVVADLAAADGPAAVAAAVERLGVAVDHLVNNAGFGDAGGFVAADAGRALGMIDLNCRALVDLSRRLLPGMIERRRGGVLNVASTAAFQPLPFMSVYAASKAFVLAFTEGLATELRGTGVRAMALCPGPVPTRFQARAGIPLEGPVAIAKLSAEVTAARALRAYQRGKRVYVPGFWNRFGRLSSALTPRCLLLPVLAGQMRKAGRAKGA